MKRYDIRPLSRKAITRAHDQLLSAIEQIQDELNDAEESDPIDWKDSVTELRMQLDGMHSTLMLLDELCFDN